MITLENECMRVLVGQGRGARIEGLYDKKTKKEWIWKPRGLDPERSQQGVDLLASFDENWAGGWEEVFPNDAATEAGGFKLHDHGEVWRRPWALEEKRSNGRSVTLSFNCETYPVFLRKRISISDSDASLTLEYELQSRWEKPLPYLFKFHPAIAIEPGDEYRMPHSMMEPVALGFSRILGRGQETTWPNGEDASGKPVRVDVALPDDQFQREFIRLSAMARGECAILNRRTQTGLTFEFSKDVFPYVWLFQSYGGFMGHYVAMMEPTNSGHYDLRQASREGKCGTLLPRQRKTFSVSVKLFEL